MRAHARYSRAKRRTAGPASFAYVRRNQYTAQHDASSRIHRWSPLGYVVRWRCVDLCDQIAERFDVEVHERTVGKLLRRMGLSRVQPRPHNPKRDLDAQEAFKKTSPRL